MNLKRVAVIAVAIWAVAFGLHHWLNSEPSVRAAGKGGAARAQFTVAYIPVT